jgi:hypothetical protein
VQWLQRAQWKDRPRLLSHQLFGCSSCTKIGLVWWECTTKFPCIKTTFTTQFGLIEFPFMSACFPRLPQSRESFLHSINPLLRVSFIYATSLSHKLLSRKTTRKTRAI